MRLLFRITPVLLGLALAACSGIRVNTNYDPTAVERIDDFRRYAWLPQPQGKDARVYNDIIDVRVRMAVDQELKARGYQRVDMSEDPDFLVGWQGAIDTKVSVDTVDSFYGYPWGPYWSPWSSFYGPYGYPYGMGARAPMSANTTWARSSSTAWMPGSSGWSGAARPRRSSTATCRPMHSRRRSTTPCTRCCRASRPARKRPEPARQPLPRVFGCEPPCRPPVLDRWSNHRSRLGVR